MLQPNEPVIAALRQDIIELKATMKEMREDIDNLNVSIQGAFQGFATGTNTALKFLDARVDDLETRITHMEVDTDLADVEKQI